MSWNNVVNLHEVEFKASEPDQNYEYKTASIAQAMGAQKLGFHVEILLPKRFSCPYHFHFGEEEMFLVLAGRATLRQNNEFREVKAGDLILCPTGPEFAHQFYNHTDEDFRYFALSTKDEGDVCEYPDSGKVLVRRSRGIYRKDSQVPYEQGETNPKSFWPSEKL